MDRHADALPPTGCLIALHDPHIVVSGSGDATQDEIFRSGSDTSIVHAASNKDASGDAADGLPRLLQRLRRLLRHAGRQRLRR